MNFNKAVKDAIECLEMFHYTKIQYLGNGFIRAISPLLQKRVFLLSKLGKDFTLCSQRKFKYPLPSDFKRFECEFLEENERGELLYKIYYSDYILKTEVQKVLESGNHNLKGVDLAYCLQFVIE